MGVKLYKPTSPSRRFSSIDDRSDITKHKPEKSLITIIKKHAGRNNQGKITVRHRGGGVKRFYRQIDFKRNRYDETARVTAIEYDPNRSARIALLEYADGMKSYIVAPRGLVVNDVIVSSRQKVDIKYGNRLTLAYIPSGSSIHNIEIVPGRGGQMVRSAGNAAQLMSVEGEHALVRLPSGEIRRFSKECMATLGEVGNPDHQHVRLGKAGRRRRMGWRPSVRGKAMNPVDHPHGGGEGNQPIGLRHPKTPQGRVALGAKTRRQKKYSDRFIIKHRKK